MGEAFQAACGALCMRVPILQMRRLRINKVCVSKGAEVVRTMVFSCTFPVPGGLDKEKRMPWD